MKDFFKFTLATVTGIVLSGIVLFIIGVVTLVGIISSSDTETVVKKNSVMMLDLNGVFVERTQQSPLRILSQLFSDDSNTYGLDDILSSIKKANSSPGKTTNATPVNAYANNSDFKIALTFIASPPVKLYGGGISVILLFLSLYYNRVSKKSNCRNGCPA